MTSSNPANPLETLTRLLARLPGLGPRSARRAVLHLLKRRDALLEPLCIALRDVADRIDSCVVCGNLDTINPCSMCEDTRRDQSVLCVVEDVADLHALERSHAFHGIYHVLGGTLSALDGVRPEDLRIDSLIQRCHAGGIDEVILALNATLEGQTTAHYVTERLAHLGMRVTRLAQGMPLGGELDYLDDGTLMTALESRRAVA